MSDGDGGKRHGASEMNRLDEVRERTAKADDEHAFTDREYLVSLLDRIAALPNTWRMGMKVIEWNGKESHRPTEGRECARDLEQILNDTEQGDG